MLKIYFLVLLINTFSISTVVNAGSSLKIIDGDTIILNSEKIRFYGIDTPEIKQTCTNNNGQSYSCGVKATLELKKIIGSRKVSCIKKTKDRYKRSISICYVDGKDINSLMVKKGWALAYRKYSKKYVKDEVIAKSNKAGIWSGYFIAPWKWRGLNNKKVR